MHWMEECTPHGLSNVLAVMPNILVSCGNVTMPPVEERTIGVNGAHLMCVGTFGSQPRQTENITPIGRMYTPTTCTHACIHLHTPTVTVVTSVDPCYMYTVYTEYIVRVWERY